MSINKDIARSASVIGLFTFCSRILGFIRDAVIARMFGVYIYAQAFVIAFKIPNLLRDLIGEGATNAAFVPVLSEYALKRSKEEFWELSNAMLNLMLVILTSITLLGIMFSPLIVRLIAPGFMASAEKLETTIRLTRIIFPYILLISLTAYSTGILNSLKHFAVCAFAPCLLNISIIVFALLFAEGIKGLACGVLLGGVLQLAVQIPVLYKKGFRLRVFKNLSPAEHSCPEADSRGFLRGLKQPAIRTMGRLMLPRILSSSIYQLNNFVDSIFGSWTGIVGEGGVAVLYFSYRLIQFPLGIFSNALFQASLPALSEQALEASRQRLRQTLSWGLRTVFFVMLPASVGLMVLAAPIISILFGGRRFDSYSVNLTSSALFFYSIGLFAYGATKVLQSGFFALKDTLTPAKVAGLALIMNIVLNSILMFPFKIGGIALATSISGIITFLILFVILKRRLGGFDIRGVTASFTRILSASLGMGGVCYFASSESPLLGAHKILWLGSTIMLAVASYIIFCFIFKVSEIRQLWRWVVEKRKNC